MRGATCEMRRVTLSEIHRVHTRAKAPGIHLSTPLVSGKIYSSVGGLPANAAGRDKSLSPQLCAIGAAPSKTAAPTNLPIIFSRAACPHPTLPEGRRCADVQPRLYTDLHRLVPSGTNTGGHTPPAIHGRCRRSRSDACQGMARFHVIP